MMRLFAAVALTLPGVAAAQALQCTPPAASELTVRPDLPNAREPKRILPIGHYTLAISWSPQYCRGADKAARSPFQCDGKNRFGFVLHGLWPDGYGKEWPQYCRPTRLLSPSTVRANICATPSAQLLQHEWAKHGTCMPGETPDSYFRRATGLYHKLSFPDMDTLSRRTLTAGALTTAIARKNRGMRADMMRITTDKGGWLDEVWLCLDKRFRYAKCPAHQGGVKPATRVRIWRGER